MNFHALDLPPDQHEMTVCAITAATKYKIPANIMLAIAEKEGGKPGKWSKNKNGTHDVGYMQFNTDYLVELKKYGIHPKHVAAAGCYSFDLAAWRISNHINDDNGDLWTKAANYHSRTPKYNRVYREDMIRKAKKWGEWLEKHFRTVEMKVETDIINNNYRNNKTETNTYTPRNITISR